MSAPTCVHGSIYCPDCDNAADEVGSGRCDNCDDPAQFVSPGVGQFCDSACEDAWLLR